MLRHYNFRGTSSLRVHRSRYADSVNGGELERNRGGKRGRRVRPCAYMHIAFTSSTREFPAGAFQSICKLSTLMARQSHPVVTKHRGRHCLVCEEIVVPDRSNLSRSVGALSPSDSENKDHSALIAPSRSNRGLHREATRAYSLRVAFQHRPVHIFSLLFHLLRRLWNGLVSSIDRDKPRK